MSAYVYAFKWVFKYVYTYIQYFIPKNRKFKCLHISTMSLKHENLSLWICEKGENFHG